MRRVAVFVISFVTWCFLAWPFGSAAGAWDGQSMAVGLGASLVVALIFGDALARRPAKLLDPRRWFWLGCYIPVFIYACIKANLQVAYLVLHPAMPIRPGIVRVRTKLRSDSAVTALANSITLTPGTMTLDVKKDGVLYIHWINVKTDKEEEASKQIVATFERFLSRIAE
jgi:multicomponent Na+:H+ antiporter subunit E